MHEFPVNATRLIDQPDPTLFFVAGASAVGKTTLSNYSISELNRRGIPARRPVCYTTRSPRLGEVEGRDYNFITPDTFESHFRPMIETYPADWDVDVINENYYFNAISDIIPSPTYPVSILPVSLDNCASMVEKYRGTNLRMQIAVLAILLTEANRSRWEGKMSVIRGSRSTKDEIISNNNFTPPTDVLYRNIFPTWNLNHDSTIFFSTILSCLKLPSE